MRICSSFLVILLALPAFALGQERYLSTLSLPSGQTVVIAEGDLEARSTGSFSLRLYEAAASPDKTTFFISGLVQSRDGFVENTMLADINDDQNPEIIVIIRSAGTGSYLSAKAFELGNKQLYFLTSVEELAAEENPLAALRAPGK